ncbi:RNA polymerase sigma factor [Mesobacillus subterraneus]|uniref:RNA polymerase sigma factor n=1 Tax=Mesobacillus subterraneus TaxID=285983 RepID=A0A427TM62_9BACI|nr:RNA polymerase sigma factor [Mesobacillus subterraneus]RSD25449.1 RNA polymerase sigma factor [Mesobacillus subterraneus]
MKNIDFDELYKLYSKKLGQIAYSITKDRHLAEDVVQETFIKAYKKSDTISDTNKIGAWLAAIAARTAIDYLRAEKRRKWLPSDQSIMEQIFSDADFSQSLEQEVEILLFKEDIQHMLFMLTHEYQQVLILRLQYGLKEDEIACKLNLKSGTVKTRLHRARKQLKKVLTEKYPA